MHPPTWAPQPESRNGAHLAGEVQSATVMRGMQRSSATVIKRRPRQRAAVSSDCLTTPHATHQHLPPPARLRRGASAAARVVDRPGARGPGLRARDPEPHRARHRRRHPAARPREPVALGLADRRRRAPPAASLMVARRLIAGRLSLNVEYDLRQSLYTHLQGMSFGFYDKHQTGPAALARDERRQRGAHVPRLRPRLHHPVRRVADRGLRPAPDHELAARADHVRAAAADRDRRDALLAPLASRAARHPAAHRRRHRRRPRSRSSACASSRRSRRRTPRATRFAERTERVFERELDSRAHPGPLQPAARPPAAARVRR